MHLAYIWIVSHLSAKNYRNLWKFDEVLTKTNLLSFFGTRCSNRYTVCLHSVLSIILNSVMLESKASCPTTLGALCSQLTFHLAWYREHSAVTATELLQPLNLACGTLFWSSYAIQTSPTNCSDDS